MCIYKYIYINFLICAKRIQMDKYNLTEIKIHIYIMYIFCINSLPFVTR